MHRKASTFSAKRQFLSPTRANEHVRVSEIAERCCYMLFQCSFLRKTQAAQLQLAERRVVLTSLSVHKFQDAVCGRNEMTN